jgi:hypothetical protein
MVEVTKKLAEAVARLTLFRAYWEAGDEIDKTSHLTADDLDLIIDAVQPHADLEPGGSLTADDLGNMA